MQIGILINDKEYRDALIERLLYYDNDILVNIINGRDPFSKDCLILTDINPETLDNSLLNKLSERTMFLTLSPSGDQIDKDYHHIFKYSSVDELLSEASLIYKDWLGITYARNHSAKIISVCFENDAASSDKCMALARQIIYKRGDSVLVISLSYINDYGFDDSNGNNRFARMMYSISTGRHDAAQGFTHTDSYGISALMLPRGVNPLTQLDEDELSGVIDFFATTFDTVILDIGTCYSKINVNLTCHSDMVIYFGSGRRYIGLETMLDKNAIDHIIRIRHDSETEDAMAIDDAVNQIYGYERYEGKQK